MSAARDFKGDRVFADGFDKIDRCLILLKFLAIHRNEDVTVLESCFNGGATLGDIAQHDVVDLRPDADLAQPAALEPLGLFRLELGDEFERRWRSCALDGELDLVAFAQDDALGDAVERPREAIDRIAVDVGDLIAGHDASLRRRAIFQHPADDLGGDEILGLADLIDDPSCQQGEQHRKQRARDRDNDFIKWRDRWQRLASLAAPLDGLHRRHLGQCDKATRRNPTEPVLHPIDFLFPNRCAEPNLEALDAQAAPLGGEEVTQLVDKNNDVENHQNNGNQQDHLEDVGNSRHE